MTKIAAAVLVGLFALAGVTTRARCQSAPARVGSPLYEGFHVPTVSGDIHYSLSASDHYSLGYNGTNSSLSSVAVNGSVGFLTQGKRGGFSILYSGGFSGFGSNASPYYQSMSVSQSLQFKKWSLSMADSLSYLPNVATSGLSGVPGVGDLGLSTAGSDGTIGSLSQTATRIGNSASLSVARSITGSTSAEVSGTQTLNRFLGSNNGIESTSYSLSGGGSHRLDARSSLNASVYYSDTLYIGSPATFGSEGATLGYSRSLSPRWSTSLAGGPQRINGSTLAGTPATYTYTANLQLNYAGAKEGLSGSFGRSSNPGDGLTYGSESNTFSLGTSRAFGRSVFTSASVSYSRNSSLQVISTIPFSSQNVNANLQANRALTRTISAFLGYSAQHQLSQGVSSGLAAINGTVQTFSFGATYSPKPLHLGH